MKSHAAAALVFLVALPVPARAERPPVIVHLADGTSQPLRAWTLVYDFLSWKQGTPQMLARPGTQKTADLWAGKKVLSTAGATLELAYGELPREIEIEGRVQRVLVPVAQKVTLQGADGKKVEMKVEAPHRDLLAPGSDKTLNLLPRSLDLAGETLTGTKRSFCVLSYTTLVECAGSPQEQVVKLTFQP